MSLETMTKLATTTLGSSQSSITFSNIPQGYTDLKIVASIRSDRSGFNASDTKMEFNGDTAANYNSKRLFGDGATAYSDSYSFAYIGINPGATATASTFSNIEIDIPNYSSSVAKSY